ncbi:MAG: hypothetical protein LCI00_28285 [Chloroflexi bacterium]|nr:hypothetical protein [Chloroflexota bacterium]
MRKKRQMRREESSVDSYQLSVVSYQSSVNSSRQNASRPENAKVYGVFYLQRRMAGSLLQWLLQKSVFS